MSLSFALQPRNALPRQSIEGRRVLVTGAAGNIGSFFARHSHRKYRLRLMMHHKPESDELGKYGEIVSGELSDLESMRKLCRGMDTVVDLAANPSPYAKWSELVEPNILGVYNTFAAAKAEGCRRVIFASSIHAVCGYPPDMQVKTTDPVNPKDLYGVTKCVGEALGRYMAEQEELSVIALRIGAVQPAENFDKNSEIADILVSPRDLAQLVERCIDVEGVRFAIFNAVSDNRCKRLDITDARELLGYQPEDGAR
jgi:nucleoside-diphosphate-sugar epimerase